MILALLHLAQATIFALAAYELSHRGWIDAGLLAVGGLAQLAALARRPRLEPWLHLVSLACVIAVYARFGAIALHVQRVFGPLTGQQAVQTFGASLAALPWLVFFPAARLGMHPPRRATVGAALLLPLAILPLAEGFGGLHLTDRRDAAAGIAGALFDRWSGGDAPLPQVAPGTPIRVTVLRRGVAEPARTFDDAPASAVPSGRPTPGDALLVDVGEGPLPRSFVRPGSDAGVGARSASPRIVARTVRRTEVLPGLRVPVAGGVTWRFASAVASETGIVLLDRGWSPGPTVVDGPTIDAALHAAAAHLARGLRPDGRFTYIVTGPSGAAGTGYNYPRHAGTAWFLARVWAATGDEIAGVATDRALAHLLATSGHTADGRAYVLDPDRTDGKSWIGTTALAALALSVRGTHPEDLTAYVRQIAASVDATGKVRGDMGVRDGSFPEQPANAYGQGQAVLALAVAERAGVFAGKDALDRAIRYLDSGYLSTPAPAFVGDEHWMCLAARAIRDVRGRDTGAGICAAYTAEERWNAPAPGGGLPPAAGPGGGAAEALVARAWDTKDPALTQAAVDWARHFLTVQYRPADAPLLGIPEALVGGFRDGVGDLDVQIDAVQHIGSALLGVEALLAGRARPGSLP